MVNLIASPPSERYYSVWYKLECTAQSRCGYTVACLSIPSLAASTGVAHWTGKGTVESERETARYGRRTESVTNFGSALFHPESRFTTSVGIRDVAIPGIFAPSLRRIILTPSSWSTGRRHTALRGIGTTWSRRFEAGRFEVARDVGAHRSARTGMHEVVRQRAARTFRRGAGRMAFGPRRSVNLTAIRRMAGTGSRTAGE